MLYVMVRILQFLLEVNDFALLVVHNGKLGVDVLRWDVGDLRGLSCIIKSAQILFKISVRRRKTCNLDVIS